MSSDKIATRKVSHDVSVCGQINPQDIAAISEAGFRTLICNRPDGEEWGQPEFSQIEAAATTAGLKTAFLPISPSGIRAGQAEEFANILKEMPHPILAYCRSGARSAGLWQAAQNA